MTTSTSPARARILAAIRQHAVPQAELPNLAGDWITFPDPVAKFSEVLTFVGGKPLVATDRAELEAQIRDLAVMQSPEGAALPKVICTVEGLPFGNVDFAKVLDPHHLEDIEVAILPGEFAVAENGAVWVTDRVVPHRAIYFIAQHVVLVVRRADLLDNLHQAYDRLCGAEHAFDQPGYGLFVSGPSKTADIEQSLVIGAHGPRSMTVLLLDA